MKLTDIEVAYLQELVYDDDGVEFSGPKWTAAFTKRLNMLLEQKLAAATAERTPQDIYADKGVREEVNYRMNLRPGHQGYEAAEALYFTAYQRGVEAERARAIGIIEKFDYPQRMHLDNISRLADAIRGKEKANG